MTPQLHLVQAIGMPAGMEWLVILIIALLLFGSRLPSMMRGLGGSIKEFKKGMEEGTEKPVDPPKPIAPEGAVSRAATVASTTPVVDKTENQTK